MDWASWFRRTLLKNPNPDDPNLKNKKLQNRNREEEEEYGITDKLIDFIKTFTLDTFKSFSLPHQNEVGGDGANTCGNLSGDLSEWQQRHATLVLSSVQEISRLRYMLCPRHLKEQEFWRIYFMLVKSYVTEYELHAVRRAKLKSMETEKEVSSHTSGYEVEMAETKATGVANSDSLKHELDPN
ncbi:BSD domain [Dillenia turbinata]|uniref:BSD domain n=1 Tax=Dillenia turbinata TaxID=194707 RepID=A0AAN8VUR5_9MAGN